MPAKLDVRRRSHSQVKESRIKSRAAKKLLGLTTKLHDNDGKVHSTLFYVAGDWAHYVTAGAGQR